MPTKQVPDILYHYTTMEVLYSIITKLLPPKGEYSHQLVLWATHAGYMNDPMEFNYFNDCLDKGIIEYELANQIPKEQSNREVMTSLLEYNLNQISPVISLSASKDNLPMWRCYSDNGQGVAIGFSFDTLNNLLGQELVQCEYPAPEEIIQKMEIGKLTNTVTTTYTAGAKLKFFNPNKEIRDFYDESYKYKHPAYSYENEWRLVLDDPGPEYYTYEYRLKNGLVIPYIPVEIPINAVREIWIGPTANKKLAEYSLKKLLESKVKSIFEGENPVTIQTSSIPYTLL